MTALVETDERDRARALQRARLKQQQDVLRVQQLRIQEQELLDRLAKVRQDIADIFRGSAR